MREQNPFETLFSSKDAPSVTKSATRQGIQRAGLLGTPLEVSTLELHNDVSFGKPRASDVESIKHLGDQYAGNVVVFQKVNRIISDQQGVFVPQSLLGRNVEISQEIKRSDDGVVRVIITSYPRDRRTSVRRVAKTIDSTKELRWLAEHRSEYAGQWVALDGERLLASGKVAGEVYKAARESGVELPLVVQVESSDELPFGGW